MMKCGIGVLFCCLAMYVTAARADDAATESDVRCMLLGFGLLESENPVVHQSGLAAAMYFIGRLDGRDPKLDLETAAMAEIVKTSKESSEQHRATAVSCGKLLQDRGAAITAVGKHIVERGKRMMQMENSR
jgi:hypothetical protein